MQFRTLGKTGVQISALSFGAGPISTLMTGDDAAQQRAVVQHAIQSGINWFDTAATYGQGQSESNLGRTLHELGIASSVHVATKVRLMPADLDDIPGAITRSLRDSLQRLNLSQVTLLQLHNSLTRQRGDESTSITPPDVLNPGGVADAFEKLRAAGLVNYIGLTGIGQPPALAEVVRSGRFDTIQVPYHLLNPSAGQNMPENFPETNYGNVIAVCAKHRLGVLAIRVLAGGALAGNAPSPHTLKTPFFPLSLYERDLAGAQRLQALLGPDRPLASEAIRFALAHPQIHSALIGFGATTQIDEALQAMALDSAPLDWNATCNSSSSPTTSPI